MLMLMYGEETRRAEPRRVRLSCCWLVLVLVHMYSAVLYNDRLLRADLEQIQLILSFVGTPPPEDRAWIRSEKVSISVPLPYAPRYCLLLMPLLISLVLLAGLYSTLKRIHTAHSTARVLSFSSTCSLSFPLPSRFLCVCVCLLCRCRCSCRWLQYSRTNRSESVHRFHFHCIH